VSDPSVFTSPCIVTEVGVRLLVLIVKTRGPVFVLNGRTTPLVVPTAFVATMRK
jgi:hypothetical protein